MNPKGSNGGGSGRGSPRGAQAKSRAATGGAEDEEEEDMESGLSEEEDEEEAKEDEKVGKDDADGSAAAAAAQGGGDGAEEDAAEEEDSSDVEEEEDEDEEEEEEEDSSDMDVGECERRRTEFGEEVQELERQFTMLREQLYRERITQIDSKLDEVRSGKAGEYLQPLEELQVNMKNRLEVGDVLRQYRLSNIHCKHDAEMLAAEQNFASEKDLLWDSLKAELEDKIHLLEEDKHNVDFSSGLWEMRRRGGDDTLGRPSPSSSSSKRRRADPMDPDRRKKPVTVSGPFVVYMLSEAEILDDWTAIKKALSSSQRMKKT